MKVPRSWHRERPAAREERVSRQHRDAPVEAEGYDADPAVDGREPIACIERQRYAAVSMEVRMPDLDGLEASSTITARSGVDARPRIAAMIAKAMQGDREECFAAGTDDDVTKPDRVDQRVDAFLRTQPRKDIHVV